MKKGKSGESVEVSSELPFQVEDRPDDKKVPSFP